MPRPKKCRKVGFVPRCLQFVPNSVEDEVVQEVVISIEEVEAVRLSDYEGLEQNNCAERMGISRGTFQRIINLSRRKVADALVNGKAIRIEGGCYKREHCTLICKCCGHKWNDSSQENDDQNNEKCSCCDSKELECVEQSSSCRKHCRRFGIKHNISVDDGKGDTNE